MTTPTGGPLWRSEHDYDRAAFSDRNYSGTILLDGVEVAQTRQCKHCGCHYVSVRGSGTVRGWCSYCNGPTCGSRKCCTCVPVEQWLTNVERGLPPGHRPVQAAVRGEVPTL